MTLSRRKFLLSLIASGVAYHNLDFDRLLWIPGEKKIFIPSNTHALTLSQIVAAEWARVLPHVKYLFERDDTFYVNMLKKQRDFTTAIIITDRGEHEFD
jgi:hypothetical protein